MPYAYEKDPNVKAAQILGEQMARDDEESEQDAAQDAALAYLEQKRKQTGVVTASLIKTWLVGQSPDDPSYKKQRRPLLRRSYSENLEELPEWAL